MLSAKLNDIKGAELSKLIKVILSVYFEGGILLLPQSVISQQSGPPSL